LVFRPRLLIIDGRGSEATVVLDADGDPVGFLRYKRGADPEDWQYDGCLLGCGHPTGIVELDDASWREITPELLRRLADDWKLILDLAKAWLATNVAEETRALRALERRERRGGRGLGTDFYKGVALEYRRFVDKSGQPTTSIAKANGVSRGTASRWVRRARELGFLGPAMPRRAGESTASDNEIRA
jgi:hypothetical protein